MNILQGFVGGVVLWMIAYCIGPPVPIILWTVCAIGLLVCFVVAGYRAYCDPDKKSLLMWGRFYIQVGIEAEYTNDRADRRAFVVDVGFERPEDHK